MMIKLFLVTLFCATLVFANSSVHELLKKDAQQKPMSGFRNTADHFMDRGTSSLVRRSAYGSPEPPGPPGPPRGNGGGEMAGGFNMGGGMGGGMGGNAGVKQEQ